MGGTPVGLDAAHVRWFAYDGPDELDNGLALCVLHHKLFDRGALASTTTCGCWSAATTPRGRRPAGTSTTSPGERSHPAPGTPPPAARHLAWHRREVFKGGALVA